MTQHRFVPSKEPTMLGLAPPPAYQQPAYQQPAMTSYRAPATASRPARKSISLIVSAACALGGFLVLATFAMVGMVAAVQAKKLPDKPPLTALAVSDP